MTARSGETDAPPPEELDGTDARCAALEHLRLPVWVFDVDHQRILWANPGALALWGAHDVMTLRARDLSEMSVSVRRRLAQFRTDCERSARSFSEHWTFFPEGRPLTAEAVISPFPLASGRMALLVHVMYENREGSSETLRSIQALMHTTSMISLYDTDWKRLYCNPAARDALPDDGDRLGDHFAVPSDLDVVAQRLEREGDCELELPIRTVSGLRWHAMDVRASTDAVSGERSILVSAVDITERRRAQEEALRLAYSDTLTGLANRPALLREVERLIQGGAGFDLLFLDLDRFKLVNDSLGHGVGDALLVAVARRLRELVDSDALVSRLGGDEFVVVTGTDGAAGPPEALARRLLGAMAAPFPVGDHRLHVLPSIGICRFPEHGATVADLLRHADMAMYAAKSARSGHAVFDREMNRDIRERLELENDLALAARRGEFENHYQPRIDTRTGVVSGFEALIRWRHPTRGLLSPSHFIGIAEDTGMIVEIGNRVMRDAMHQQRAWHDAGYPVHVSINISARQFTAQDLYATVARYLDTFDCEPSMIELEITESVLLGDTDKVSDTLERISALGVRIAIDDFGTGYSNLAYLKRYPLDCLKVDRVFVADPDHRPLLEVILSMGRVLGLTLVAEGIETDEQADWLADRGCDEVQGFLYSRPIDARAASDYLGAHAVRRTTVAPGAGPAA